jgi:hypothetical protein
MRWSYIPLLGAALFFGAAKTSAQSWDILNDFSSSNNPAGAWSYGSENPNGSSQPDASTFTLLTTQMSDPTPGWEGPGSYPNIWMNETGGTSYGVAPGQVSQQPAPSNVASVIRWTDPAGVSGTASIVGQFYAGDSGIMTIGVFYDGTPLWTGSDSGTFNLTQSVSPGDTIDFAVYGGFYAGNTPTEALITVPEPVTLSLISILPPVALARRPRRNGQ